MTIRVALEHQTTYRFDREVGIGPHIVRLRPAPHCRTPIVSYSLRVEPGSHFLNWQQDAFGNYLARLVFPEPASELSFTVDLVADLTVINPFDFFMEEDSEHYPVNYGSATRDLAPYLVHDASGPLLDAYVAHFEPMTEGEPRMVDLLVEINQQIQSDVAYTTRMEPGVQTPDETLEKALGSCRDSGWLMVAVLRRLGLAARFVSGYLVQLSADQKPLDGPAGPAADFTDLHAWCEVYVPGAGWIGLDPTSGLFAGEGHIPLCCTPQPASAAPIEGSIDPTEVDLEFANVVRRIHEDPRVTLPYSEDQWTAIDELGHRVDARLSAGDVRLTLGGEPTFVSIDDMEGAEWTIDADGEDKRRLSWDLTKRLAGRFATGHLFHHGQGKWYPGEPLPRWQMGVHWRTDGVPLWADPSLLGDPDVPGTANIADAQALSGAIARRLGVDLSFVQPAFEDPIGLVWDEARQPAGSPPSDLDPTDPLLGTEPGRKAALSALEGRAGQPAGFVLPLHPTTGGRWMSTRWTFRRGRLLLVPGDSPLGLRLPLGAISWTAPPDTFERSPFARREPLPPRTTTPPRPAVIGTPDDMPPTALCVEVRDGQLRVFLPPVEAVEDFVAMLEAVEAAATQGRAPVIVEGYPPPRDPRLTQLVVTPDPGVIEVNVQPAASWPEMVDLTTTLYEEARACRLGTEKFDIDGAHWGTGGGNHLTLGGSTPADSPLLRRPDLLRSLITYWQHHPSLSYLFSGRFVGPTSQAPRVDEGRDDVLDELDVAFGELDRETGHGPARPWLVDRLFRHLLADLTGNTHRSEFCIDKLFSPDSERGRLGLLELRGFEMPPHPQMSLVQALLVRAIVARCWSDPYEHRLVRWGNELHDRFLLPHEVAADVAEVVDDLAAHGLPFQLDWLAPFLEFRFPRLGAVDVDGVHLELRAAVEPWLVLGEETAGGGTARYVDSSVERLQVLVEGAVEGRHVLTCNGIGVPLREASGAPGAKVAGVRYKAWQPPSSLHPTMPVHTPLVFDVIDTWNDASLGGCTYHVSHPGGLSYETFPVNANEAEARRGSRFVPFGHTGADIDFDRLRVDGGVVGRRYPRTLDLRRHAPR